MEGSEVVLDKTCVVAALRPSSITLHKTTVEVEGVCDGKVNLRPPLLTDSPHQMTGLISVNRWCC